MILDYTVQRSIHELIPDVAVRGFIRRNPPTEVRAGSHINFLYEFEPLADASLGTRFSLFWNFRIKWLSHELRFYCGGLEHSKKEFIAMFGQTVGQGEQRALEQISVGNQNRLLYLVKKAGLL